MADVSTLGMGGGSRLGTTLQNQTIVQPRTGRWSVNEQLVFLSGLKRWGKGRWKEIGREIPTR